MKKMTDQKISIVCINRYNYSNIDLESLLSPLGGIKKYISPGEKALIKAYHEVDSFEV